MADPHDFDWMARYTWRYRVRRYIWRWKAKRPLFFVGIGAGMGLLCSLVSVLLVRMI